MHIFLSLDPFAVLFDELPSLWLSPSIFSLSFRSPYILKFLTSLPLPLSSTLCPLLYPFRCLSFSYSSTHSAGCQSLCLGLSWRPRSSCPRWWRSPPPAAASSSLQPPQTRLKLNVPSSPVLPTLNKVYWPTRRNFSHILKNIHLSNVSF
jgi:hypothetical protein